MARPTDELRGVSEHVYYEVEMLRDLTHNMIPQGWPDEIPRWQHNALLESFAVHARGLIQFFYEGRVGGYAESTSRRSAKLYRNAYAHDFFGDATWRRARPKPKPESLRTVAERVGREIAHLTYNRLTVAEEAKNWPYGTIFLDVARTLRAFLSVVPEDRVADGFLDRAWALLPGNVQHVSPRPEDRFYSVEALRAASRATAGMPGPPTASR